MTILPTAPQAYDGENERAARRVIEAALSSLQQALQRTSTSTGAVSLGDTELTLANGNNNNLGAGYTAFTHIIGPSAAFAITGIAGGETGRIVILTNTTAQTMTLAHQSASSSAVNRIISPTGADLAVTGSCLLIYDSSNQRWRAITTSNEVSAVLSALVDANGNLICPTGSLSTSATDGFFYLDSGTGTPTGTPTSKTGRVPLYYDTTNNRLWVYSPSGSWRWGDIGNPKITPGGRLTPLTGTTSVFNVTGATTLYYTPYHHLKCPVYDGSRFVIMDLGGELSQTLADTTKSPSATAASNVYDVFIWDDNGTPRLSRGPAWTVGGGSNTVRGTGAGSTQLVFTSGILVNAFDITNGPLSLRGTYVGTIATDAANQINMYLNAQGTTTATLATVGVWNMYNRLSVVATSRDTTGSWTYALTTVRARNGNTANARFQFVSGLPEEGIFASRTEVSANGGAAGRRATIGFGLDTTSSYTQGSSASTDSATGATPHGHSAGFAPQLGSHFISINENAEAAFACTFYQDGCSSFMWRC